MKSFAPHSFSRSLLSLTFITTLVTAQTIHVEFSPVASSLNSTDDYLFPLKVGSNGQTVYLTPSFLTKDTTIFSSKTCTPPGSSSPNTACINYRGGVFDSAKSASWDGSGKESKWKQNEYGLYANGVHGTDKVEMENVILDGLDFVLADACNMTSGMLGLAKDSVFLNKLKEEKKIASRSYGLHVGVDIMNHPDPIADPSFDDGRNTYASENYTAGLGHRWDDDEEEKKVPVRDIHNFPGSITFGGYDKAKIDTSRPSLTAPIASDGSFSLKLKSLNFQNVLPDTPIDFLRGIQYDVIIDADTPHFYFPNSMARWMGKVMGSTFGDPGIDFFHSYIYWDEHLGTLNFTLEATNNGKTEEITISVPPTVFYQPLGFLKNFVPTGVDDVVYYSPFRSFDDKSKQPIILGRSFLKAAYLYVNHETSQFQLSQVAFTNSTSNIISVDPKAKDIANASTTSVGSPDKASKNAKEKKPFPIGIAAGAGGGALVVLLGIVGFFLYKRKKKAQNEAHSRIRHSCSPVVGGRMELEASDPHPGKPLPLQTLAPPQGEKFPPGPPTPVASELPSEGVYAPQLDQKSPVHMASSQMVVEMPVSSTPTLVNNPYPPPPTPPAVPTPIMSPVSPYIATPTNGMQPAYPPPVSPYYQQQQQQQFQQPQYPQQVQYPQYQQQQQQPLSWGQQQFGQPTYAQQGQYPPPPGPPPPQGGYPGHNGHTGPGHYEMMG